MASINKHTYPQKYFLEGEALQHFAIKGRTYKRWLDEGTEIPGRYKVKGTNYYVIEPHEFHAWLIETRIEKATQFNKFHNRKAKSRKGGKPTRDVVPDGLGKYFPSGANKSNGLST